MIRSRKECLAATAAIAAVLAAHDASASGFALKEQSTTYQGTSFAGATAGALDASTIFFNPAGMTSVAESQVIGSASYIMPQAEFSGGSTFRATGGAVPGDRSPDDGATDALVPSLYALLVLDERARVGIGINAPWGLATEYESDWVGRYHALKSELTTVNIQPSFAYRVLPQLSLGAGLQIQKADAELSQAVDFGSIGASFGVPGLLPGNADGRATVAGDDTEVGFTVGLMFEPRQGTRIGASWRSAIIHELEGTVRYDSVPAALRGAFPDSNGSAELALPDVVALGVYHELSPQWAVMADVAWTNWSLLSELAVDAEVGPDSEVPYDWEDTWFFSLGAHYRPTDNWVLRAGIAYDQSPIPDERRTPRVPDEDRYWVSLGAGYKLNKSLMLDAAYTHIFVEDASIDLAGTTERLTGSYESAVDIFSVQVKYVF